jgi:haloalkane dehalogenase
MRGYVDGSWGQVHYRCAGEHGPWLVLLHESPLSSAVYGQVLPLLARDAKVIAFDTPGYGMSDGPSQPREIPDYARELLAAADRLEIRTFTPVGVHTGASLATSMALQAGPHRVPSVVLSGVPVLSETERASYLSNWAPRIEPDPDGRHLAWAWHRYQRIWGADSPAGLLHLGAVSLLENLPKYHWGYNAAFRYDPLPDLRQLQCRMLFLTAEHDLLVESDRTAAADLPGAQLCIVPGLRGQLPLRAPDVFARSVLEFAREGELPGQLPGGVTSGRGS